MIKKIKQYFARKKQTKEQKAKLLQMQKYYEVLRSGALFIQFIQKDLKESKNKMNRHQRRRMEKSLIKGEITEEIVKHYQIQIDRILKAINRQLNPPKEIDGAKLYESLKKKEAKK